MLITKRTDYALRILRTLSDGKKRAAIEICEQEDLPLHFTHHIMKQLHHAGLLEIVRGKSGGARLRPNTDLTKVSLYDLLDALGERHYVSGCLENEHECDFIAGSGTECSIYKATIQLQEAIDNELKKYSAAFMIGLA
jgi:Rrf2 family protein